MRKVIQVFVKLYQLLTSGCKMFQSQSHWILRTCLLSVFFYLGATKLNNMEMYGYFLHLTSVELYILASIELFLSVSIVVGGFLPKRHDWLTRLSALGIMVMTLRSITTLHWGQWSFIASEMKPLGGMELPVIIFGIALYLLICGNDLDTESS